MFKKVHIEKNLYIKINYKSIKSTYLGILQNFIFIENLRIFTYIRPSS